MPLKAGEKRLIEKYKKWALKIESIKKTNYWVTEV